MDLEKIVTQIVDALLRLSAKKKEVEKNSSEYENAEVIKDYFSGFKDENVQKALKDFNEIPDKVSLRYKLEYALLKYLQKNEDAANEMSYLLKRLFPSNNGGSGSTTITQNHRGSGDNIGNDIVIRGSGDSNINTGK